MKTSSQSMSPDEAALTFFGQDDAAFSEILSKLTTNDPRLASIFQRTRKRFLEAQNS